VREAHCIWCAWLCRQTEPVHGLQHKVPDKLTDPTSVTLIHSITKRIGMLVMGMPGELRHRVGGVAFARRAAAHLVLVTCCR
jgi:hypothetical protein